MADFQFNNFISGLITDVTDVNSPENSLKEVVNMDISFDGSIFKRNALKESTTLAGLTLTGDNTKYWIWEADTAYTYRVVFDGVSLVFYDYTSGLLKKTLPLTATTSIDVNFGKNSCYVATGKDLFHVTSKSDGSITDKVDITLKVRDFSGLVDETTPGERPATLTDKHKYNLFNQGWGKTVKEYSLGTSRVDYNHVQVALGVYPSNSDNPTVALQENPDASAETRFRVSNLDTAYLGTSKAPKGSIVLSINDTTAPFDNSDLALSSTFIADTFVTELGKATTNKPTTVAFHVGRVFYSGISGDNAYTSTVLFSKLLNDNAEAGECLQDADPTSPDISEIIDTDGGAINIPEASRIFKLIPYKDTLLVFASNGIWGIKSEGGFSATIYQVYKVADVTPISGSVSLTEFGLAFATKEGLFTLTPDEVTGNLSPINFLLGKVQKYYNEITDIQKLSIKIAYDSSNKRLNILYKDLYNVYTNMLILNVPLQSFYTYKFTTTGIKNFIESPTSTFIDSEDEVYNSLGELVTTSLSESVTVPIKLAQNIPTKLEFLTGDSVVKIAALNGSDYNDLGEGVFEGTFTTNPFVFKDLPREKQVYNLHCQFKKTETGYIEDANGDMQLDNESSCLVQSKWDYSSSNKTGKFGTEYQAYRHKRLHIPDETLEFDNYTVVESKRKLRGSGKALQLKFTGESGKHLNMLGYSLDVKYRGMI